MQVKKTASLFTTAGSPDKEAQIVSGKIIYDGLGRPVTTYYPTTTTTVDNKFSTTVSTVTPTKTEYDEVGRAVKVTLPDGSTNATAFTIENYDGVQTLHTTQTDALNKTSETYTDATGQNLASMQNDLLTKIETNALGETIKVTDAMDHITKSSYDWLGRRTEFTHPDAGTTIMQYDLAGNLISRITQDIKNTVPNDGAIQYEYNYNRLESIKYPKNPQNNVQYNYGKSDGTASRRGRLWFVQDASGGQEFFYGKLGEIEKEIRTLRITPTDIQTYVSEFAYDTWNRIQKMTYPDGEVVEYTYNRAGNLQSMQGKKESHTYDYIKQLSYDEFEQRKYLKYGNDTETNYTYDDVMRRLQQLQVKSGTRQVMNNSYSYDLVGNVLGIKNTAPIVNNTLGGTSNHEYQYDDFYRLKSAKATYQGEFTKASYELNMSYNKMHNITKKDLVHTVNNEQKGYVLDYNYDNELHPNAPNKIVETGKIEPREYVYDGNGNPTSYAEEKSFRKMTWDEENRLMGINDNGRIHQFTYDASGERVIKSSGDSQNVAINGETAATIVHTDDYTGYVSPYFVISKGKFTKHYFEGAGRIVSKLGNGSFAQPLKLTAGGVNYGKLTAEQQKALDNYVRGLGVPPGPPTQQGIYATPEFTGDPYPSEALKPVEENQEPPEGWPRNPVFNVPGDVPGPPVQFGPPVEPETVKAGEGFTGIGMPENDIFYFHPDHLGSTSYITSKNGSISQHVEYIAFGEVLFEEHSSSFSSPYLFNGKELDRETNLSYYGARYLDMKTSLWLSVDPLAEEFLHHSPYNYCFNNPLNLIDPSGMGPEDPKNDPPTKGKLTGSPNLLIFTMDAQGINEEKMNETSGKYDWIAVSSPEEAERALKKAYGDKTSFITNLAWRSHGSTAGAELSSDGAGPIGDPAKNSSLKYIKSLLTDNANVMFTACSLVAGSLQPKDRNYPSGKAYGENFSSFFVGNSNRKLFLNYTNSSATSNHYFNDFRFDLKLNEQKRTGFLCFTKNGTLPAFYNLKVNSAGGMSVKYSRPNNRFGDVPETKKIFRPLKN
ncbi:RHS repeat-associated core domain-containing protein [uncultured Flavobacterium sp.]|uniref:RHS repeat-associated core domain-containing protein n=1 Tax=uncultured Flavobacterium sp. TaxID=165435 RepID=UPI0025D75BAE|nr:RHS repeat-associated core domain-containing protein [uncultured Flavobacterium sp.]